eukprot:4937991-Ditylum_brightwellii.AAC.1
MELEMQKLWMLLETEMDSYIQYPWDKVNLWDTNVDDGEGDGDGASDVSVEVVVFHDVDGECDEDSASCVSVSRCVADDV